MYRMSEQNTPGLGTVLSDHNMPYVPEAHCYLQVGSEKMDLTSKQANLDRIAGDILEELEIMPQQVGSYKVEYHKMFIRHWITREGIDATFEEIWAIREACIQQLSG